MCPLCRNPIGDRYGNVCPSCYLRFENEKEAAKKKSGVLPEAIVKCEGLTAKGYHAWLKGKLQHRGALSAGKSDDEAERIGFAAMEEAAKKEREGLARQQARIAKERADLNRLFRHT